MHNAHFAMVHFYEYVFSFLLPFGIGNATESALFLKPSSIFIHLQLRCLTTPAVVPIARP